MKKYQTINWNEKDLDEVYIFWEEELDETEHFAFLKWLMENFPQLDIDWVDLLLESKSQLPVNERIEAISWFSEWYQAQKPAEYKDAFGYFEQDLCDYYLYKNESENLQKSIDIIAQNPVKAIDTLTVRMLFQLIFHGHYQQAVQYAEVVWKPIDESEELIANSAYPFVNTIYVNELQKCYEAGLNKKPFDEDALFQQSLKMGFEDDRNPFNQVLKALTEPVNIERLTASIQKGKDEHLLELNVQFLKYMFHNFQLPFVFSEWIWNFIATSDIFGKHEGIENWFYIDFPTLNTYIGGKLDRFYSMDTLETFAKTWGLDYVFSFLHHHKLVSDEHYKLMLENSTFAKGKMMRETGNDLWQMKFVFSWPRIDNQIIDPSEENLFDRTYDTTFSEALENIDRYLSTSLVPQRIQKELLNSQNSRIKKSPLSLFSESLPYVKQGSDVGRNDACPCGSGKKYKKCCLNN